MLEFVLITTSWIISFFVGYLCAMAKMEKKIDRIKWDFMNKNSSERLRMRDLVYDNVEKDCEIKELKSSLLVTRAALRKNIQMQK